LKQILLRVSLSGQVFSGLFAENCGTVLGISSLQALSLGAEKH